MSIKIPAGLRPPLAVALAFWAAIAIFTKTWVSRGGGPASRLATAECLVEYGTCAIDQSRYAWTVDKALFEGRYYSDKPLPLSLWLAGVYAILYHVFGLTLAAHEAICVGWITRLTIGLASAALAGLFWLIVCEEIVNPRWRLYAIASLFCSPIVFSATVINPHTVAAFTLFAAYFMLRSRWESGNGWRFCAGLMIGISMWLDPAAAAILSAVGLAAYFLAVRSVYKVCRATCIIAAGTAVAIAAGLIINKALIGQWLPFYLTPSAYDYPGSFHHGAGPAATSRPFKPLSYAFHCLFGYRGYFLYTPTLIFALLVPLSPVMRKDRFALALWAGCVASAVYFCFFTADMGGWWYGFRFLFALTPFFALLTSRFLEAEENRVGKTKSEVLRKYISGLAAIALAVSFAFTVIGLYNPTPICREGIEGRGSLADLVRSPAGANLLCMAYEYIPESSVAARTKSIFFRSENPRLFCGYLHASFSDMGKQFARRNGFPETGNVKGND